MSPPQLAISSSVVPSRSFAVLRLILGMCGAAIAFLGINVGFGGIPTLGWQGSPDFVAVTDQLAFGVQDNHVRFLGGVWLGVGLFFLLGALAFRSLTAVLISLCGLIFVGGLARLSALDPVLLWGADIGPSLFAELIIFPALALWIWRAHRTFVNGTN